MVSSQLTQPLDGGWGWCVVFGTFLCLTVTMGVTFSYGVLFVAFVNAFGQSKSDTAWTGSIFTLVFVISMSFGNALREKIGHRLTVIVGGVVASIGLLTSSFATHLHQLYFTYGVLVAVGCGMATTCALDIIPKYFKKRYPLAMGLALSGSGVGQVVFSLSYQVMINFYGWRGMLLILSAFVLHICVSGCLFRPLKPVRVEVHQTKDEVACVTNADNTYMQVADTVTEEDSSHITEMTRHPRIVQCNQKCCVYVKSFLACIVDVSLLRKPVFLLHMLISICYGWNYGTVSLHMLKHTTDIGIDANMGSYLLALMGGVQLLVRPISGAIGNLLNSRSYIAFSMSSMCCAVATIGIIYLTSFAGQIFCYCMYGMGIAGFITLNLIVLIQFNGRNRFGHAVSMLFQVSGITTLLVSPFAGRLRDKYGVYTQAFWIAAAVSMLGSILSLLLPVVDKLWNKRNARHITRTSAENVYSE
ncbi:monocarboxylate transporter 13-like [Saccoglossus kowalevskii]|uniref:Monocarboxylate transporter 12-like n=1 Tax=Saccoglossus kowalevskii TaxID=10224 RepID=A0ABM0GRM7_SACKO|nr:PREDICTED: monocarboxylate transporter 12-like [Saccoglossus kowalevskii]